MALRLGPRYDDSDCLTNIWNLKPDLDRDSAQWLTRTSHIRSVTLILAFSLYFQVWGRDISEPEFGILETRAPSQTGSA